MLEFPQFPQRIRISSGIAAALLLAVFLMPRSDAWAWQLLDQIEGLEFARLWFLAVGGTVLGAAALLPVPTLFRSTLAVAALLVWLSIGGVALPFGLRLGVGIVSALLCASLLVRAQMAWAQTPRQVGVLTLLLIVVLYLWPLSAPLPALQIWSMLTAPADPAARFVAIYLMLPIPVALLSLVVHVGSDLSALGETLAWLVFMWGPGALLILSVEPVQIYASVTTFAALLCASYGLAEPLQELTLRRDGY